MTTVTTVTTATVATVATAATKLDQRTASRAEVQDRQAGTAPEAENPGARVDGDGEASAPDALTAAAAANGQVGVDPALAIQASLGLPTPIAQTTDRAVEDDTAHQLSSLGYARAAAAGAAAAQMGALATDHRIASASPPKSEGTAQEVTAYPRTHDGEARTPEALVVAVATSRWQVGGDPAPTAQPGNLQPSPTAQTPDRSLETDAVRQAPSHGHTRRSTTVVERNAIDGTERHGSRAGAAPQAGGASGAAVAEIGALPADHRIGPAPPPAPEGTAQALTADARTQVGDTRVPEALAVAVAPDRGQVGESPAPTAQPANVPLTPTAPPSDRLLEPDAVRQVPSHAHARRTAAAADRSANDGADRRDSRVGAASQTGSTNGATATETDNLQAGVRAVPASAPPPEGTTPAPSNAPPAAIESQPSPEPAAGTGVPLSIGVEAAPAQAPRPQPAAHAHWPERQVAEAVGTPGFAPALGATLAVLARDGIQQARLQLNPSELGPIAVQIAVDGSSAHIEFHAAVAATRNALEVSLPALAGALRENGLTLTGGGVHEQSPGRGDGAAARWAADGGGSHGGEDRASVMAVAPMRVRRGLVDLIA